MRQSDRSDIPPGRNYNGSRGRNQAVREYFSRSFPHSSKPYRHFPVFFHQYTAVSGNNQSPYAKVISVYLALSIAGCGVLTVMPSGEAVLCPRLMSIQCLGVQQPLFGSRRIKDSSAEMHFCVRFLNVPLLVAGRNISNGSGHRQLQT